MKRFAQASDAQFADLERRAINGCVRFFDVELPLGAIPNRAMIGFEVDPATRCASLLVQRGVHYTGPSHEVAEWLGHGEKVCPNFAALQQWILTQVCSEFPTTHGVERPRAPLPAHQLTDLNAVTTSARNRNIQSYVPPGEIVRRLSSRVCGQIAALTELSGRVSRHLARISPQRPLTLMAIGPTGTGKTKTAETLPSVLHEIDGAGGGYAYLRVDCSELTESHRVSQLLGAPPGYVGHTDGAQLIDQLAANPRTVVLFDEIEKAHADVLKVLLNAIDCGRFSSSARHGNGHVVDARRAIFYFTANLECERILTELHARSAFAKSEIVEQVCRGKLRAAGLKPEFVGRITSFLVFQPLTADVRAEIAVLSIVRIAEEYGLRVERVAPEAIVSLLSLGKADDFGARPIEFLVDNLMGDIFAQAAAAGITAPLEIAGAGPFICNPIAEKRIAVRSDAASSL
jgi:Cdc48 subfamily AAA family protein